MFKNNLEKVHTEDGTQKFTLFFGDQSAESIIYIWRMNGSFFH